MGERFSRRHSNNYRLESMATNKNKKAFNHLFHTYMVNVSVEHINWLLNRMSFIKPQLRSVSTKCKRCDRIDFSLWYIISVYMHQTFKCVFGYNRKREWYLSERVYCDPEILYEQNKTINLLRVNFWRKFNSVNTFLLYNYRFLFANEKNIAKFFT